MFTGYFSGNCFGFRTITIIVPVSILYSYSGIYPFFSLVIQYSYSGNYLLILLYSFLFLYSYIHPLLLRCLKSVVPLYVNMSVLILYYSYYCYDLTFDLFYGFGSRLGHKES